MKKHEITQISIAANAVGLHTECKSSFTDFESEHSNNACWEELMRLPWQYFGL
jgi:hypothetical protein